MDAWNSSGDYLVTDVGGGYASEVASLTGGGYVVAWVGRTVTSPLEFHAFAQRFNADGNKVGVEIQLSDHRLPAAFPRDQPGLVLDGTPDGGFVAAWSSNLNPTGGGSHFRMPMEAYVRRVDENGEAIGSATLVNESLKGLSTLDLHTVALPNGNVVVSWTSVNHFQIDYPPMLFTYWAQLLDETGALVGDPMQSASRIVDVVPDAGEGFYLVRSRDNAQDSHWVDFQHFNALGEALGQPVLAFPIDSIHDSWPVASTLLANGDLLIALVRSEAGSHEVRLLRHDGDTGVDQVSAMALPQAGGTASNFKLTGLLDGGFVLSWAEGGTQVVAQHFGADAVALGEPVVVNELPMGGTYGKDYDIEAAPDGGVIVAWDVDQPEQDIYIERFGPNAAPAVPEYISTEVTQLYVSLFGRAPDGEGWAFWSGLMQDGWTTAEVADTMFDTEPARAYYPDDLSHDEIVTSFYVNVLGRMPDEEGLAFWSAKLDLQGATPGSVMAEIIDAVADYNGTNLDGLESAALFHNRVVVAQYFGEHNATLEAAIHAIEGVTSDPLTIAPAIELMGLAETSATAVADPVI